MHSWLIGIGLACLGSCFSSVGLNLQRLSQAKNAAKTAEQQRPAHLQPLNVIGLLLMVCEAAFDGAALGYASNSTLAPFSALTMGMNLALAPMILGEKLGQRDMTATGLIFIGTVIAVSFSKLRSPSLRWYQFMQLMHRMAFLVYFPIAGFFMFVLFTTVHRFRPSRTAELEYMRRLLRDSGTIDNAIDGSDDIDITRRSHWFYSFISSMGSGRCWERPSVETRRKLHRRCVPIFAGFCGGFTAIFGKAANVLIMDSILGKNQFLHFGTWIMLGMLLISIGFQVCYLNIALKYYESLWVVPIYTTSLIFSSICNGSAFYADSSTFSVTQWIMFPFGIVMAIGGVLMLMSTRKRHEDDDSVPEMLEPLNLH